MIFNQTNVDEAVRMMRQFADEKGLGKPTKVLLRDNDPKPWSIHGVGLQWDIDGQEPVRNALTCSPNDLQEIKRRFEEWKNEA